MDLRNRVCNLCLVKCENFKSIKGNRKIDLGILLPTIEFTAIQEPVVCEKCEEVLKKCINFKTTCLRSYDCIVSLVNNKDAVKLDIKDIYLSKNVTNAGVSEDQGLCGLCMNLVENCHAISLDVEVAEEGNVILEKMIEQCLPELDLSIFKNPIMCDDCHRSLENCFRFVTDCLTAEEKIKEYCETLNVCSNKIELSGLLHSTMGTVEANGDTVDVIKAEKQFCVKIENPNESTFGVAGDVIKLEQISCADSEYINDIGNKNEILMTSDKQKVNNEQQFTPKNMFACADANMLGTVKIEETVWEENKTKPECGDFVETDDQKFILSEEIEVKTDEHDLNRTDESIIAQTGVNAMVSRRGKSSAPHHENRLLEPHFKQTFMKKDTRKKTGQYECGLLQTKNRQRLKKPSLISKTSSEAKTVFKCDSCPYQSSRKHFFNIHILKHMDSYEEPIFNCGLCSYQTKYKGSLKQHLLIHKPSSELTTFKCDSCVFQTIRKPTLKHHMLKHMVPSEVPMFNCDLCSFRTKYKWCLKEHLLTHKTFSEITTLKCDSCPYQTRRKFCLKTHMLKHMDPSEVPMFNCDLCSFRTKYKSYFTQHLVTHKATSEITTFKCDSCPFQTKRKRNLKVHKMKHMNPSDLPMFSCDFCLYQTKDKNYLKRHSAVHKESSEVTMFKCDSCTFQTKWKGTIKYHMLKHMNPSDITMFSCDLCSYQTKYKKNLKRHLTMQCNSEIKM